MAIMVDWDGSTNTKYLKKLTNIWKKVKVSRPAQISEKKKNNFGALCSPLKGNEIRSEFEVKVSTWTLHLVLHEMLH